MACCGPEGAASVPAVRCGTAGLNGQSETRPPSCGQTAGLNGQACQPVYTGPLLSGRRAGPDRAKPGPVVPIDDRVRSWRPRSRKRRTLTRKRQFGSNWREGSSPAALCAPAQCAGHGAAARLWRRSCCSCCSWSTMGLGRHAGLGSSALNSCVLRNQMFELACTAAGLRDSSRSVRRFRAAPSTPPACRRPGPVASA